MASIFTAIAALRPKFQPSLPANVTVGRHTYGMTRNTFFLPTAAAPVTIGNFCSIADDVRIMCHANHPLNLASTYPFRTLLTRRFVKSPEGDLNHDAVSKGPIVIGHDVWIGERVTILPGTTIGTGSVIGACAVVSGAVPPYSVVVGNPAKVIRKRHPEHAEALLASRWWDLPDETIFALDAAFYIEDIPAFLQRVAEAWARSAQA